MQIIKEKAHITFYGNLVNSPHMPWWRNWIAQQISNLWVRGSNPCRGAKYHSSLDVKQDLKKDRNWVGCSIPFIT